MYNKVRAFFLGLGILGYGLFICAWVAMVVGYVMNLVHMLGYVTGQYIVQTQGQTIEFGLRIVGLFIFPLGSLMGLFS